MAEGAAKCLCNINVAIYTFATGNTFDRNVIPGHLCFFLSTSGQHLPSVVIETFKSEKTTQGSYGSYACFWPDYMISIITDCKSHTYQSNIQSVQGDWVASMWWRNCWHSREREWEKERRKKLNHAMESRRCFSTMVTRKQRPVYHFLSGGSSSSLLSGGWHMTMVLK